MDLETLQGQKGGRAKPLRPPRGGEGAGLWLCGPGEAREDSDLDLLVAFEEGRTLLDHARLKLALEGLLGVRVDIVSERGLAPRLREQVLREAIPL